MLDPAPIRPGVRSLEGLASLQALDIGSTRPEAEAVSAMVSAAGLAGVHRDALVSRAGVAPVAVGGMLEALAARGVVTAGEQIVARSDLVRAGEALVKLVTAFHRAQPLSDGLPREEARERYRGTGVGVREGGRRPEGGEAILVGADRLALSSHSVAATGEDARIKAAIASVYEAAGLKPPDAATVQAAAAAPAAMVEKITAVLIREKVLVKLDTLAFHAGALAAAEGRDSGDEDLGTGRRGHRGRGGLQGQVRNIEKVRDPAAGISRSGARDKANG